MCGALPSLLIHIFMVWCLGTGTTSFMPFLFCLFFMPVYVNSAPCSRSLITVHIKMKFVIETENDFLQELYFQFDLFLILPAQIV